MHKVCTGATRFYISKMQILPLSLELASSLSKDLGCNKKSRELFKSFDHGREVKYIDLNLV